MSKNWGLDLPGYWHAFWTAKKHVCLPNYSLVPKNDPSILWINSGMASIKPFFTGQEKPPSQRLFQIQNVLRTSDFENVGKTNRHQTFFQMMGNFSLGDYFKTQAITWAWEFLTANQPGLSLGFDKNRLYVTVYQDDTETAAIWQACGVEPSHIIYCGKQTNWWDLGEGPCGPSSEIFFDRGPEFGADLDAKTCLQEDLPNERYLEIWNIVFSSFNHLANQTYIPLPNKNIDTGMGFERMLAVLENAHSNFDTSLFAPIFKIIFEVLKQFNHNLKPYVVNQFSIENYHYKVIADHLRAISHCLHYEVFPDAHQRGYVVRKLMRNLLIHCYQLSANFKPILDLLVERYVQHYNQLHQQFKMVQYQDQLTFSMTAKTSCQTENKQFNIIIQSQLAYFQDNLEIWQQPQAELTQHIFYLHTTKGFDLDLFRILLDVSGIKVDWKAVQILIDEHQTQSRAIKSSNKFETQINTNDFIPTTFVGYEQFTTQAELIGIYQLNNATWVQTTVSIVAEPNQLPLRYYLVFNQTPFYAQGGGQTSDHGTISTNQQLNCHVVDVIKIGKVVCHVVELTTVVLTINQTYTLTIDVKRRQQLTLHHLFTHLLLAALQKETNYTIHQHGSNIDPDEFSLDILVQPNTNIDLRTLRLNLETKINNWLESNLKIELETIPVHQVEQFLASSAYQFLPVEYRQEISQKCQTLANNSNLDDIRFVTIKNATEIISLEACKGTHISDWKQLLTIFTKPYIFQFSKNIKKTAHNVYQFHACLLTTDNFEKACFLLQNVQAEFKQLQQDLTAQTSKLLFIWKYFFDPVIYDHYKSLPLSWNFPNQQLDWKHEDFRDLKQIELFLNDCQKILTLTWTKLITNILHSQNYQNLKNCEDIFQNLKIWFVFLRQMQKYEQSFFLATTKQFFQKFFTPPNLTCHWKHPLFFIQTLEINTIKWNVKLITPSEQSQLQNLFISKAHEFFRQQSGILIVNIYQFGTPFLLLTPLTLKQQWLMANYCFQRLLTTAKTAQMVNQILNWTKFKTNLQALSDDLALFQNQTPSTLNHYLGLDLGTSKFGFAGFCQESANDLQMQTNYYLPRFTLRYQPYDVNNFGQQLQIAMVEMFNFKCFNWTTLTLQVNKLVLIIGQTGLEGETNQKYLTLQHYFDSIIEHLKNLFPAAKIDFMREYNTTKFAQYTKTTFKTNTGLDHLSAKQILDNYLQKTLFSKK